MIIVPICWAAIGIWMPVRLVLSTFGLQYLNKSLSLPTRVLLNDHGVHFGLKHRVTRRRWANSHPYTGQVNICLLKCGMKLLIQSQTSRAPPLKFGNRPPVNSAHKGQWRAALMLSLTCAWINGWVNNGGAGDLRRHRLHYDVIVMICPRYWHLKFERPKKAMVPYKPGPNRIRLF